ncbi:DUF484 family protein [Endozoicomonas sp. G2_1]|uniref:DUF484 family protein n=1 Tax=Endozoicomonas sp. G2_1 TaxID=2821091 RepID=UPI001AD99574|nr:DUF484 family protein [Endozoicomonas sp. G2_1]MBO9489951.1 DUF484 family protein [Endozoicomonas sp. G2_1]
MSESKASSKSEALLSDDLPLTDELIVDYLQAHPEFFQRNGELLTQLKLADNQRGVVSLVERQQQQLRKKVHDLEEEITQLMAIANHNEQLFSLYNDLYLRLIDCNSIAEIVDCLHTTTTELLSLANCRLWLSEEFAVEHQHLSSQDCRGVMQNRLTKDDYYFGRLQQSEHQLIFDTPGTGSVVLIKLTQAKQELGFIAIASDDAEHFDPRMDTLLLSQFRKLVAKLLSKQSDSNK